MRINKYLASANLGSRRKVEEFVRNGEVKVNGKVVCDLAFDVKEKDVVEFRGERVSAAGEFMYVMLHKPKGVITSTSDDRGRKTVIDLMPEEYKSLKPIGRLDYDSEGLLLLTNQGDLVNKIMRAGNYHEKEYFVTVRLTLRTRRTRWVRRMLPKSRAR